MRISGIENLDLPDKIIGVELSEDGESQDFEPESEEPIDGSEGEEEGFDIGIDDDSGDDSLGHSVLLQDRYNKLKEEKDSLEQKLKLVPVGDVIPKKPTLEDCDWDAEVYEQKLTDFLSSKKTENQKKQDDNQSWQNTLNEYEKKKNALPVRDFSFAEENVKIALSPVQQGILIASPNSPEKLVYVIGKNAKLLKELSDITDPVKFTYKVAEIEGKIMTKKSAPNPEKKVVSGGKTPVNSNKTLEQLEKEAERTGDRTAIVAFKKKLKSTQKSK